MGIATVAAQSLTNWRTVVFVVPCFLVSYFTWRVVYNLFFHPLARLPGPKTAALSNLLYCFWFLRGKQPYDILQLHRKYGPIVRTAPNEVSFNTARSWKDIYDFRPGHKTFVKSEFYEGGSFADQYGSIVSERDPAKHGQMRRYLSHAFSQKSLSEQELLISGVVDRFIDQLGRIGSKEDLEIVSWMNMMTFDIIGDLAFGETFHGIEKGEIHPWIARIEGAMMQGALADCFKRFPWIAAIVLRLVPGTIQKIIEDTKINERYSIELIKQRIARTTDRKDFLTRILEHKDSDGISDIQIAAHASDFVLAGSETTATTLACVTYYLFKTPHALEKLQQEVRSSFKSYDDINAASTTQLKYLQAVALEGLRIYPPLPFALPRVVPEGGDTVDGTFLPAGTVVSTNPVAASLDERNFADPMSFRPERWMDEKGADQLEASQPFSLGTRGCLGRSLGWMELRTTIAKLHYKYDLKLVSTDLDWQESSRMHTLWQKPKMYIRVAPRKE